MIERFLISEIKKQQLKLVLLVDDIFSYSCYKNWSDWKV